MGKFTLVVILIEMGIIKSDSTGCFAGLNWVQVLAENPGTYGAKNNNCTEKVEALGGVVGEYLCQIRGVPKC